jgi:predicted NBD/HSP70 family sugar kinase
MTHQNLFIGIDLGATKISTALVDAAGKIIARDYRETRAAKGQKAVVERMVDAAYRVMGEAGLAPSQVTAVGVGSPGPIDSRAGVVTAPPNLPGWKLVNLFNPKLIVIGGGLTNMGEGLFGPVRRAIERRAFPAAARAVNVVPAELGDDVGVLGAVAAAMAQMAAILPQT